VRADLIPGDVLAKEPRQNKLDIWPKTF